jgi:hypothetical protein
MPGNKAVKERIEQLIAQAPGLQANKDAAQQKAWLVAAQNAVQLVCPSPENPYHVSAQKVVRNPISPLIQAKISEMAAMLARLLEEIGGGLLTTVENHAIAVTFDAFLDHGAEFLRQGRKNEAGAIAGIVFEDTLRQICRVSNLAEKGVNLDALISELVKKQVLTKVKANRARSAAGLRTSALHAHWDEFEIGDVKPVIEFTKELIEAHLG